MTAPHNPLTSNMALTSTPHNDEGRQIARTEQVFQQQKQAFSAQPYLSVEHRIGDLLALKSLLLAHQNELAAAIASDYLYRSDDDSLLADFMPVISAINYSVKHLRRWMKPNKRQVNPLIKPAKAYVFYQPLGVVGVICPWNYPLFLSLIPLVSALSAGNCVMIKMSEFTPATNRLLTSLLLTVFEESQVAVIQGEAKVSAHFSAQPFDHLLFTGSTAVGKKVMRAAAEHLTPLTLELGGKSPTIIDEDIKITVAVERFILGKVLNAGQTCVAPDYILCPSDKVSALVSECRKRYTSMYPHIANNKDHTGAIHQQQLARLQALLADAKAKGARIITLSDESEKSLVAQGKMALTLVCDVTDEMRIMQEEIFGPILPIVTYQGIAQAIDYINARPKPLALYLCSFNKARQQQVIEQTHAGGMCINETVLHVAVDDLPFGGVGASGMGRCHGKEGFITFSNAKAMLVKGKFSLASFAFPPFGQLIHRLIYRLFIR